jgi:ACS family tartrate transporter-like MFS transporter
VDWLGLPGWRWIFIVQGIAPVLAGVATLFVLPDRPADARWLPPDERDWLTAELAAGAAAVPAHGRRAFAGYLGVIVLLTAMYFCQTLTSYGLIMFMPAIIKSQSGLSDQAASFLATLPFVLGMCGMLVNGWHSDRTGERFWHTAVPLTQLGLGVLATALLDGVGVLPVLTLILVVGPAMQAHLPAFWPIPSMMLKATAAASAIGFINMLGNLGGFVGPTIVGKYSTGQESFAPALFRLAPWPLAGAAIILVVRYCVRRPAAPPPKSA